MGLGALCIERERLAHQPFGLDEIAALGLKNAVEMKCFELIGVDGESLLVERFRCIKRSGLLASHPALNNLDQFGWLAEHPLYPVGVLLLSLYYDTIILVTRYRQSAVSCVEIGECAAQACRMG